MPYTTTATVYRYGSQRFGITLYGGLTGANVGVSRNVTGIIFLTSNDRYQVVTCSYGGTSSTPPEFRYWYAAPPSWGEELNGVSFIPPYFVANEDGIIPVGSIETPYRLLKAPQEARISGVMVEFIPRPGSLTSDQITSDAEIGFTVQVEGQGVPDYVRDTPIGNSGIVISNAISWSEDAAAQTAEPWPNIRTQFVPCRLTTRVRAARVLLSNISLCEIVSVSLVGGTDIPGRSR